MLAWFNQETYSLRAMHERTCHRDLPYIFYALAFIPFILAKLSSYISLSPIKSLTSIDDNQKISVEYYYLLLLPLVSIN